MAEAAQAPRKRPLSPHLQVYRLTLSMVMSGVHCAPDWDPGVRACEALVTLTPAAPLVAP